MNGRQHPATAALAGAADAACAIDGRAPDMGNAAGALAVSPPTF